MLIFEVVFHISIITGCGLLPLVGGATGVYVVFYFCHTFSSHEYEGFPEKCDHETNEEDGGSNDDPGDDFFSCTPTSFVVQGVSLLVSDDGGFNYLGIRFEAV